MPLFYSLISRDNDTILAETDPSLGNHLRLSLKVLHFNKLEDGSKIFSNKENSYYLFNEGRFSYLCVCEVNYSRLRCLAYLKDLKMYFRKQIAFIERDNLLSNALNSHMKEYMKERMKFYNQLNEEDAILKDSLKQFNEVEIVVKNNLDYLCNTGQNLLSLEHTTKVIRNDSTSLGARVQLIKRQKWYYYGKKLSILLMLILMMGGIAFLCISINHSKDEGQYNGNPIDEINI